MAADGATRKVLVLGREERAFLAAVRSFGRRGLRVHVGWAPPHDLALRSRYVTAAHAIPAYAPAEAAWREALCRLCRAERFDLVVPTTDATVVPLQRHRAELEPSARFYLIPDRAFAIVFDKARTYDLAVSLGIPVPPQRRVALPVGSADIDPAWFPVVLKPLASLDPDVGDGRRWSRIVDHPGDLARALPAFSGQAELLVQQCVAGIGTGIEVLASEGEVLVAFQHLRLHTRHASGADSFRGSVPLHAAMLDAVTRMVRALGYTGVAMFEFIWDRPTGRWVFLEINGRFWGSLPLCLRADVDFPYWLYQLLVEGRRDFPREYRHDVFCRNWTRDIAWLRENLSAPSGRRLTLRRLLGEIGPLLCGREGSDTLVLDDPGPGFAEIRHLTGRLFARLGSVRSAPARV